MEGGRGGGIKKKKKPPIIHAPVVTARNSWLCWKPSGMSHQQFENVRDGGAGGEINSAWGGRYGYMVLAMLGQRWGNARRGKGGNK